MKNGANYQVSTQSIAGAISASLAIMLSFPEFHNKRVPILDSILAIRPRLL